MVQTQYGTAVYCSVEDVERKFRNPEVFGNDTNPSDTDVLRLIEDASDQIDDYTRTSFRDNQVIEESKTFDGDYQWGAGRPAVLSRHPIRTPFDGGKGDKIELWDGNSWNDWVAGSETEGRGNDYWVEDGHILWLYRRFLYLPGPQLRVTYRYGKDVSTSSKQIESGETYDVIDNPQSIRKACANIVAIELLSSDLYSNIVPGGDGGPSPNDAMQRWEADVYGTPDRDGILDRHKIDPVWVEPL